MLTLKNKTKTPHTQAHGKLGEHPGVVAAAGGGR